MNIHKPEIVRFSRFRVCGKHHVDADEAGKVVALIERENKAFKRDIPYRIMFSMTSVIQSREDKHIRAMLAEAKIPLQ